MITVLALVFLFVPLILMVLFSFHKTGGLSFPFTGFSLRWYREVFASEGFRSALQNSAIVASCVARRHARARYGCRLRPDEDAREAARPMAFLFFLPITLPGLFLGISMLVYFVRIDVTLSLITVVIAHFVYVIPYYLLIAGAAL